jgi:hypothetical protein
MIKGVSRTRAVIESALQQRWLDDHQKPVRIRLLPALSKKELDELARSQPVPPASDIRELLEFCSGIEIEGALEQIDFTGPTLRDGVGAELLSYGLPVAHDGFGNHWVVDFQPGNTDWGPVYFCGHDAPVVLLQSTTVEQFVSEVFNMYIPPHSSLIDAFAKIACSRCGGRTPGVIAPAEAIASTDHDIQTFAASVGPDFEIIDLRNAPIGMGSSWGRYGPRTEVKRFGALALFAYRRPEKKGLMSRLRGRQTWINPARPCATGPGIRPALPSEHPPGVPRPEPRSPARDADRSQCCLNPNVRPART